MFYLSATENVVLLNSIKFLFKELTISVKSSSECPVNVIKECASLLCTTLQYITRNRENVCEETFRNIYKLLKDWINQSNVIGGDTFGGSRYQTTLYRMETEVLFVWQVVNYKLVHIFADLEKISSIRVC